MISKTLVKLLRGAAVVGIGTSAVFVGTAAYADWISVTDSSWNATSTYGSSPHADCVVSAYIYRKGDSNEGWARVKVESYSSKPDNCTTRQVRARAMVYNGAGAAYTNYLYAIRWCTSTAAPPWFTATVACFGNSLAFNRRCGHTRSRLWCWVLHRAGARAYGPNGARRRTSDRDCFCACG